MGLRQVAARGVAWTAAQNVGSQAISFLVLLILARLLEPASFGLVAMANVVVWFLKIFVGHGLTSALVQRRRLDPEHLDTAFWITVVTNTGVGLLCLGLAGPAARFYGEPDLAPVLQVMTLSFAFGALSEVQVAVLRRKLAFRALAVRQLAGAVAGGTVGISLAYSGYGVWSLVARELVLNFTSVVLLWMLSDWRPGLRVTRRHLEDLLGFGLSMLGTDLVAFLSRQSDHLLIGYFLGATPLGYYTIGARLVLQTNEFLGGTVNMVAWPLFSKLQEEQARLREAFLSATRLVALAVFPGFALLVALAPEIVPLVFGEQWAPSAPVLRVLGIGGLLYLVQLQETLIVSLGKPHWRLALHAGMGTANLIAFFFAVRYGILAVATCQVVMGFLAAPVAWWMVRKLIDVRLGSYLAELRPALVGTVALLLAIFGARQGLSGLPELPLVARTAALAGAGGLAYTAALALLFPTIVQQVLGLFRSLLGKTEAPA